MAQAFDELVAVMARLRAPGGCPWDAEQTHRTLGQYLLEEAYEAFDAIQEADATGDTTNLREELGDVLLQVVFHSEIAAERGDFTIEDVATGVAEKLIRRHPHVFGELEITTADEVLDNWDKLKEHERATNGKPKKTQESLLDEVPVHFPALLEGLKLTKKAAKVGFDWDDTEQIFAKLDEEVRELRDAIVSGEKADMAEEIGDLLFVVQNLARRLEVEPETALKETNRKFRKRFGFIERRLKSEGRDLESATLAEMDSYWNESKARI